MKKIEIVLFGEEMNLYIHEYKDSYNHVYKGAMVYGLNCGVLTSLAHYRPGPTHPRGIEPLSGGWTDVYLG